MAARQGDVLLMQGLPSATPASTTFRWSPQDGSGPASVVEIELEEAVSSTRLTVIETLVHGGAGAPTDCALGVRWTARLVLLGCCLLRAPVGCR